MNFDFAVSEITPAVQGTVSAGTRFDTPVTTYKRGEIVLMTDPIGQRFCFGKFLARGYEEIGKKKVAAFPPDCTIEIATKVSSTLFCPFGDSPVLANNLTVSNLRHKTP